MESGDLRSAASAAADHRIEERDYALGRLDEAEVKERLLNAFDVFVRAGFVTHLIGVKVRGGTNLSLVLESDGVSDVPLHVLDRVRADQRLDAYWDKNRLVLYARFSPPDGREREQEQEHEQVAARRDS